MKIDRMYVEEITKEERESPRIVHMEEEKIENTIYRDSETKRDTRDQDI